MNRRELLKFPVGLALSTVLPTFGKDLENIKLASPLEVERFSTAVEEESTNLWWDVRLKRGDLVLANMWWRAAPGGEISFTFRGTKKRLADFNIHSTTF